MNHKIELGQKVRCKVTGFEGIATSRIEFLNGCVQYCVKPKINKKDQKMPEGEFIDQQQLEVVKGSVEIQHAPTGGDMPDTPKG